MAGCEEAVRRVLTAQQRSIFDEKEVAAEAKRKRQEQRNATPSRLFCPTGRITSLGHVMAKEAEKQQEAEDADAKRKAAEEKKEKQMAAAQAAAGTLLEELENATNVESILPGMKGEMLKHLCMLLELPVSGTKRKLQTRIKDKLLSLRPTIAC